MIGNIFVSCNSFAQGMSKRKHNAGKEGRNKLQRGLERGHMQAILISFENRKQEEETMGGEMFGTVRELSVQK